MFTEIYLGKEILVGNSVGEKSKEVSYSDTSFFCEEKSVRSSEFYQAMYTGLKPEKVISMNRYEYWSYFDDAKRKFAKVVNSVTGNPVEYTIIREYETINDTIELTLTRGIENVRT